MHTKELQAWKHGHSFGQDIKRPGEKRTLIVIIITGLMMFVEIVTGILFGSMALLADGLHMASHTVALGISAFAYIYARRHAHDDRYSFGTGKVNALGGFAGAVLLAVFAVMMAWVSVVRFIEPVTIAFNQAIFVAVLGLIVNGVSMLVLGHSHEHEGHDDASHEPADHFGPALGEGVEADASLVAVDRQEQRPCVGGDGTDEAVFGAGDALDADDVGAHVAQKRRTVRSGNVASEVEDANAAQRIGHGSGRYT